MRKNKYNSKVISKFNGSELLDVLKCNKIL